MLSRRALCLISVLLMSVASCSDDASGIPRNEAEAFIVELVDRLGPALLPGASWTSQPLGSENGPAATGCGNNLSGGEPDAVTVPYEARTQVGATGDAAEIEHVLTRATELLAAEGFDVAAPGGRDRVGGHNSEGYFAGVSFAPGPAAFVVFASTPCVQAE